MNIDLKSLSRKELEKLKSDVERALIKSTERDRKAAIVAAQKAAREHGFALADITIDNPAGKTKKPRKKAAKKPAASAKYQHPENPSVTWSGKGRRPAWIVEAEEAGKSRAEFLIKK